MVCLASYNYLTTKVPFYHYFQYSLNLSLWEEQITLGNPITLLHL